jgi:hypothetical protein
VVYLGPRYGDPRWCVEWVTPIEEIEADIRRRGMFVLVDVNGKTLRFYGYKTQAYVNQLVDSLRGRGPEMVKYLIARARARGEIT